MKSQIFALPLLLLGITASAQTSRAADRKIGDTYQSSAPITFHFSVQDYVNRPYHPVVNKYLNTAVISSHVEFQIGRLQLPATEYPAQKPYFKCSGGDSFFGNFEYQMQNQSSLKQQCIWDENAMREDIALKFAEWAQTKVQFNLEFLAPDLNYILGKIVYEGSKIPEISGAGRTKVEFPVKMVLGKCQRKSGEFLEAKEITKKNVRGSDLREVLASLRSIGLDRLVRCEFNLEVKAMLGDIERPLSIQHGTYMKMTTLEQDDRLFLKYSERTEVIPYNRTVPNRDLNAEMRSLAAAEKLIQFVTEEYGDLLYRLDNAKKSDAEKEEIIKAFFAQHEGTIRHELKEIDDNYSEVSLMNKISMLLSFDRMYFNIRQIETRVSKSNLSLDRVISRPVP